MAKKIIFTISIILNVTILIFIAIFTYTSALDFSALNVSIEKTCNENQGPWAIGFCERMEAGYACITEYEEENGKKYKLPEEPKEVIAEPTEIN